MRRASAWILAVAVAGGVAGSAVAYARTSPETGTDPRPVAAAPAPHRHAAAQVVRPGTRFRWAPCPAAAHLEHGVCVVDVVRTVVLPAPAPAAPPPPPAPAGPVVPPPAPGQPGVTTAEEPGDHESEPEGDHEGEHDGDHHEPGDGPGEHEDGDDG